MILNDSYIINDNRRKFRSQTSDNMDRWKAEQGRGHPWFTTTNLSYRFPIFETSATALCGTTGSECQWMTMNHIITCFPSFMYYIYIRILIIWIQNCQAFDGLKCSWQLLATPYGHNRVYLNPPWSQLDCWLEKAGMLWTTEDSGLQFWSCPNLSTVHSGLSWASFRQR